MRYIVIFMLTFMMLSKPFMFLAHATVTGHDCTVSITDSSFTQDEQNFLDLLNAYRASSTLHGGPLYPSKSLMKAAGWMGRDLATNNYFAHIDSLGRDPGLRDNDCGSSPYAWRGENVAGGYDTPALVLNAWKNSPAHNALMLDPKYVLAGIKHIHEPTSYWLDYWVLDTTSLMDDPLFPVQTPTSTPKAISSTPTPTLTSTPTLESTPTLTLEVTATPTPTLELIEPTPTLNIEPPPMATPIPPIPDTFATKTPTPGGSSHYPTLVPRPTYTPAPTRSKAPTYTPLPTRPPYWWLTPTS